MANGGKINFEVGFVTDSRGLKQLKSELAEIRSLVNNESFTSGASQKKIQAMVKSAKDLELAMNSAFDVDLNTVNIQKFNQILKQSGTSLTEIRKNLKEAGDLGQSAFLRASAGLMQFNSAAKQTNKFLDSIATSFANTIKWSAMSSIVNTITGTIQKSYYYVKDLDTALNDIRIVTGKSTEEMSKFAEEANNAAKALAVTTEDYTQGSLIYYQQGLDDKTVKTLTDITAKTSNVTGQSMSAVSEELTAVWNGYQVANEAAQEGMQVYEEYVDKMAAVGASTASDLQELSTAMSKVASAASAMGVGFDDLNAQIATIVSVTRQAPESVGTALKTIYARLGDLKVDGVDEFGVKLGEVSAQLKQMGIEVLDQSGNLRDMTPVMAEVAEKWNTWTEAQKQAAAVAMAGKRQYNNLIALFDNWDMYGDALKTSMEAAGTLEEQQAIALDSLSNKMDKLKATAEDLYDSLYDEKDIKNLVDGLTDAIQGLADFSDAIGGLENLIPMLGALASRIFSKQIAEGITTVVTNFKNMNEQIRITKTNYAALQEAYADNPIFKNENNLNLSNEGMDQSVREVYKFYEEMYQYQHLMTEEEQQQYKHLQDNLVQIANMNQEYKDMVKSLDATHADYDLIEESLAQDTEKIKEFKQELANVASFSNSIADTFVHLEDPLNQEQFDLEGFDVNKKSDIQAAWEYNEERVAGVKQQIINLGKESGISEEKVKNLVDKFLTFDEVTPKMPNAALQELVEKLREIGIQCTNVDELKTSVDNLSSSTNILQESFTENLVNKFNAETFTNIAGAIGQVAFSINTLKNLGNIWSDADVSTGEKFLQTVMSLSFVLPNLITGLQGLNKVLGFESTILKTVITSYAANNAIQVAGLKVSGRVTVEKTKEAIVQKMLNEGIIKSTAELTEETFATYINAEAHAVEKHALEEATIAQNTFNTSVLANPYVLVAGAIIAAIGGLVLAYDTYHKKLKEDAELQLERLSNTQKELDANEELYQSYHKLKKSFDDGIDNKDQLKEATLKLCEAYGLEADRLDLLNGRYEKINAQIEEYRKGQLEQQKRTLTSELANTATKAIETSRETKQDEWDGVDARNINFGQDDKLDKILSEKVDSYNNGTMLIQANNIKELVNAYDQIKEAQIAYTKTTSEEEQQRSKAFRSMNNWLAEVGPVIDSYKQLQEQIKDTDAEIILTKHNFNDVDSLQKYQDEISKVTEDLIELGYSEEEAKEMAETHAAAVTNATENFAQQTDIIKALAKEVNLSEEEVEKFINNLSDEEKEILFSGQVDIDNLKTLENVEKAIKIVQDQVNAEDIGIIVSLREKVTSSKKLSKKEIEEQMGEESRLGQDYEVAMADFDMESKLDQVDILNGMLKDRIELDKKYINNTGEVAAREKALYEEKRKNANLELESLKRRKGQILDQQRWRELTDEETEALKECNQEIAVTQAALDSYKKAIEHYQDVIDNGLLPEEAENKIFEDMIAGIDGVISKADVLKDLVSVVGENWTLAAGKIEEFAQNFPEVLRYQENYNVLQDGSIQLSEQGKKVLQEQMELKKQELIVENAAYQEELQHEADLLYAEAEYYEEQAQYLTDYLEGKRTGADVEAKLEKSKNDYFNKLTEITGQNQQDLMDSIVKNYGVVNNQASKDTKDIFNYWCSIGQAAAAASLAYQNKSFTPPSFNQGAHASTSSAFSSPYRVKEYNEGEYINQFNIEEIEAQRNELIKKAEAARNKANIDISKKSASESATQAAVNALDNAASGKGNGKSSSDKEKKITPKEEEVYKPDLYYEIEKAIKSVDRAIQQLEDDEKNLYGKAKIKALKEENKLLDQQLNNLKEKQKIQQQEANDLRGKLSAGGVSFSANGEVQNYNQSLESATEKYNSVIRQYNAGLVDDEQVKAAKKVLDNFKSDLDRYSKLFYDEMPELIKEMRAKIKEQLSNNLEGFELKFELKLEKKQAAREWRNFVYEMKKDFKKVYEDLDKDMARLIKNSKTYTQKNKGTIAVDLKEIKEVQKEINKLNKGKPSDKFENISQAQEKLKELNERLQEHGEELHQLYEDTWNNYLSQIDQAKSKFEDINGVLDRTEDKMNTLIQIQEKLYGGTKTYQMRINTAQTEYDFAKDRVEVARTEFELNEKLWKESGATMENMDSWNEDQKKYYENMVSAQETLLDNLLKGMEAAEKKMTASIEKIHDDLEKTFTNGFGFDELNEQWEWIDREASEYYDIIEQGYEVQKLNNQITQDAVGMSIKGQEKLKKFQNEEIKKLREKEKLSKYELKRAQAMYDITLKEIALEEARNNKSAMKLTRNSEGNWSYQYVADEGDVNKKQQDLLDAQMNFRQLAKEEEKRLLQDYNKLSQEWESKSAALGSEFREKYGKDQSEWSEEQLAEYATAQKRIQERYSHALEDIKINLSQVSRDLMAGDYTVQQTLWSQLGNDYKALTDEEIENFERFSSTTLTNFTTLYNAIVGGEEGEGGLKGIGKTAETISKKADADFHTMIENQCVDTQTLATEVQDAWEAEEEATHDYIKEVQELGEVAGIVLDKDGLEGYLNKVKIATDAAKEAAAALRQEYSESLPQAAEQVKTLEEAWKKVVSQIQKAHKKLKKYLKLKNKSNTKLEDANVDNVSASGTGAEGVDTDDFDSYNGSDVSSGGSVDNSSKEEGVAAAIWLQGASTSGWGNDPERAQKFAEKGVSGAQAIINAQGPSGQLYAKWKDRRAELSSYYYGAFDTGGYTGNWTGEGRFAMLHQKELVLNAEDTKNFLAATNSLRDLVSLDSSIEQTIANAISKMLVSMSTNNLNNLNGLRNGDSNTNNVFNINAEFPNANDVTEIREAILSLPNLANQYISKQRI